MLLAFFSDILSIVTLVDDTSSDNNIEVKKYSRYWFLVLF